MERTEKLLNWYDENRRILPWREDPSPYHVWISEIMLQQTRVEAVKAYYQAFLEVLPSIKDLAEAEEDVYLKLWEGLGYYSRVRNLHKAAVEIMEKYDGDMPRTFEGLRDLPGIGEYTAAAIASIAFGQTVPAVDGNLMRIFSRLTGYAENILAAAAKKDAFRFFDEWISGERPGTFNQALMDLGAMVCLPNSKPLCGDCPLQEFCAAHEAGREMELPVRPAKKKRAVDKMTVFVIHHDGRILLNKRPDQGLLAGLYEFPNTSGWLTERKAVLYAECMGFSALRIQRLPDAKHIFSHREWHMRGYEIFTGDWIDPASDKNDRTGSAQRRIAAGTDADSGVVSATCLAVPAPETDGVTLAGASNRTGSGALDPEEPGSRTYTDAAVRSDSGKHDAAGPGNRTSAGLAVRSGSGKHDAQDEELLIAGNRLFLADPEELRDRWSVPSAFAVFRDHLLGK